jgi:predicted transcriptional regulator of viral defense system
MKRLELIHTIEALGKDFVSMNDLRKIFPQESNLKVSVKRMVDSGVLIPVTRSVYALKQNKLDVEKIATQLYYPSYISFESALSKYGVINQGLYGLTLATTRHSRQITLAGIDCSYSQIHESLFFGFDLVNSVYLAQPEKALLDQVYLICLGKRAGSMSEWDLVDLDPDRLVKYASFYPSSIQKQVSKLILAG